jgi:hypothetical protein
MIHYFSDLIQGMGCPDLREERDGRLVPRFVGHPQDWRRRTIALPIYVKPLLCPRELALQNVGCR